MAWNFDYKPDSFETLARIDREAKNLGIREIAFSTATGELLIYREQGEYIGFVQHINLYDASEPSWKYAVGDENVDALISLRDLGSSGRFEDMQINFNVGRGNSISYLTSVSYPYGDPGDSSAYSSFVLKVENALDGFFTSGAKVASDVDQFLYGDSDTSFSSGSKIITDILYGADGNDTILGLLGNDTLAGGKGDDDLYGGYGNDTLKGDAGNDSLYGEQNADKLYGGDGNDILDGGLGADYMSGGKGNDIYYVDNAGDVIDDKGASTDVDTVLVPVYITYTLPTNIENGTLQGVDDSSLNGNSLGNKLKGNGGDNALSGGAGNDKVYGGDGDDKLTGGTGRDTLYGGDGDDTFLFGDKPVSTTVDTIDDFSTKDDVIILDDDAFTKVGKVGNLFNSAFYAGTKAHDATDRIIYDQATGKLWYDDDGTGSHAAVQFALLDKGLTLTAASFDIIA